MQMTGASGGEGLAFGFHAEGQQQDADDEGERRHRDGDAKGFKVADARAYKQSEKRCGEAANIGGKGKGAGAAFGGILFRSQNE